jgi:C-terminal processing protease CtpA/Prc
MTRIFLFLVLSALPWAARSADSCPSSHSPDLAKALHLEMRADSGRPGGWQSNPAEAVSMDPQSSRDGQPAVRLEQAPGDPTPFTTIRACAQMDFTGNTIELRGFLRTQDVTGIAGLWLHIEAYGERLASESMRDQHLQGSTDWKEFSVTLPRQAEGRDISFGAYLSGTGKVWVSGLHLLVDGKPIQEAPVAELPKTALDTDQEFDAGSHIVVSTLSPTQVANLATLGKVWGFLKYYHPDVKAGHRHWDYELFRILPSILAAPDRAGADSALVSWIETLGPVAACKSCVRPDFRRLPLRPNLAWIADEQHLGRALSQKLRWIRDNDAGSSQFYVAVTEDSNPLFTHELPYPTPTYPDTGFRLLALYRFWNMVEYWYPYRDIIGTDWDRVLTDSIPKFASARDEGEYVHQAMILIAAIHDTHANLWSSVDFRPPTGNCHLPVALRFIQGRAVVAGYQDGDQGPASGLKIGDVVTRLDGMPVDTLVKKWSPYYGASNDAALLRQVADSMTQGGCGNAAIDVRRDARQLHLQTQRVPLLPADSDYVTHDLPGPTFRLLSPKVAYLKLSAVKAADAASYVTQAAGTRGLIIDIRNYPSDFMVFALGSLLVDKETPFARFTAADLSNPGAFHWMPPAPVSLTPGKPHYAGKVVILVDETSQSQSEYTSMAFRSVPGAIVVGSTTAGADGDISRIELPGGLSTVFSGLGVFYPDKRPTQRIGIVPDVIVKPTLAGIRAGRDEVLEKALRLILGTGFTTEQIRKMYADETKKD